MNVTINMRYNNQWSWVGKGWLVEYKFTHTGMLVPLKELWCDAVILTELAAVYYRDVIERYAALSRIYVAHSIDGYSMNAVRKTSEHPPKVDVVPTVWPINKRLSEFLVDGNYPDEGALDLNLVSAFALFFSYPVEQLDTLVRRVHVRCRHSSRVSGSFARHR